MLKKLSKLFLGLVVCAGSACVTPTHASSASTVIFTHIQAASPANAKDEMVAIYNNSNVAINITNWCIKNKANVAFVCFVPPSESLAYYLEPYTSVVVASESFPDSSSINPEEVSFIYPVTNQSSGSIVNTNDTLSLIDASGQVMTSHSWLTAIPSGRLFIRNLDLAVPYTYQTTSPLLDWSFGLLPTPLMQTSIKVVQVEPGEDPEDEQPNVPDVPVEPEPLLAPFITELLANPQGSDVGNEFIELFNPNPDASLSLASYSLRVGLSLEKTYLFASTITLAPLEYRAFTNAEIKFTLLNSTSSVQLAYDGVPYGAPVHYTDPPEAYSYALHNEEWHYTKTPTPGAQNQITLFSENTDDASEENGTKTESSSTLKPCAANQYRSLETNRCRVLASTLDSSSTPVPCKANQYRSPETNRCRNITSNQSTLAPCKPGQERNLETNRCRTIVQMTKAEHGVKGVAIEEAATGTKWYWWLAIAGVVVLILAYAIWEWRDELSKARAYLITKMKRHKKVPK